MDTPLCSAIEALLKEKPTRFFMPGHKGNPAASTRFGGFFPYDITEIPGADDLSNPSGPLLHSQQNMAKAYNSAATLYSASGSTSCVQAMFTTFVGCQKTVVMARGCHISAIRALAFLDATPCWIVPKNAQPTPQEVETALLRSNAEVVYLTSPNYYGQMADIAAIAAICQKHRAFLLVDNAHGAHLPFLQPNHHPLHLGADATADSAHKTLPCLTPAALLHLKDVSLAQKARQALNLYSSTSPSYLVLQSLDAAAGMLLDAPPDFTTAASRLTAATQSSAHLLQKSDDPLKACIVPTKGGWPFDTVMDALATNGIVPELADGTHIVLMASPYNTQQDFDGLEAALAPFYPKETLLFPKQTYQLPQVACSVRQAVFGNHVRLPVEQAIGKIAAEIVSPCPPGIPLAIPGERIPPHLPAQLRASGILSMDVLE